MSFVRKDVWKLGAGWSDELLWYARAVKVMRGRPITDVTSWTFLAAMHGFNRTVWAEFKYVTDTEPLPDAQVQKTYWRQCQHQSWYFLPWHRGYLWSFETIVRAAIVSLHGPANWALPYWDYNNAQIARSKELPPAFASADWPDGKGDNPLFVAPRYGVNEEPIVIPSDLIRPIAQADVHFTGGDQGGTPGFGGPETVFHHGGERDNQPNGGLESEPHNNVHGVVGGQRPRSDPRDPSSYGLMAVPDQAALDPVFWLHHANIDRLWKVWHNNDAGHADPEDKVWLDGPAGSVFAVPDASGNKVVFAPEAMRDTTAPNLDYTYENETDPKVPSRRRSRLMALRNRTISADLAMSDISPPKAAEVIGANDRQVDLAGGELTTDLRLDHRARTQLTRTFARAASHDLNERTGSAEPDQVLLELDNIRGLQDSALVKVYVGVPGGASDAPANLAGTISGFGLSKATSTGAGNGIRQVFDISEIVDSLHAQGTLSDLEQLKVTFVPVTPLQREGELSVGAVKVVRQPQ